MKNISYLFLLFAVSVSAQNNWQQFIILPGNYASKPMYMTEYNGNIYFQARGSVSSGVELYKTNGTQSGTTLVADIHPVPFANSYPENFKVFNNQLFFIANHELYGRELFKTDGTSVTLVKDINVGIANSQTLSENNKMAMLEHNGFLYFFANDTPTYLNNWDLWKTDGTTSGTTKVLEFNAFESFGFKDNFKLIDGKFYFMKKVGNITYLYHFDPATEVLTELANHFGNISNLTEFENNLFYTTSSNVLYYTNGILNANNIYINALHSTGGSNGALRLKALGSNLIFIGANFDLYRCSYRTDVLAYDASLVYSFAGTINHFYNQTEYDIKDIFVEYNNNLYFAAREGTSPTNSTGGKTIQIYKTNGFNTEVFIPIAVQEFSQSSGNFVKKMKVFNDKLYFMMYDNPDFSYHLWSANLNNGNYERLTFPNVANTPQSIADEHHNQPYNDYVWFNNSLLISAYTTAEEKELWTFTEDSNLGISESTFNNTKISIYPNPTTNTINIECEGLNNYVVEIYDILGNKINEYNNKKELNISNFSSGVYILKIINLENNASTTHKILKQ